MAGRRENCFDAGEVILETALIICSLTLLTKKKGFWLCGSALGVVGLVVTVSGFCLHRHFSSLLITPRLATRDVLPALPDRKDSLFFGSSFDALDLPFLAFSIS